MEDIILIKHRVRKVVIMWFILLFEFVIFFLISYFVLVPEKLQPIINNMTHNYLLYFSYLSVLAAIPGGYYFYNKKVKSDKLSFSIKKKSKLYFNAVIIKFLIFEFAATISLVAFVITERTEPLYMFAITFIIVLINMPSVFRFEKDFNIEEKKKIKNLHIDKKKDFQPIASEENNANCYINKSEILKF